MKRNKSILFLIVVLVMCTNAFSQVPRLFGRNSEIKYPHWEGRIGYKQLVDHEGNAITPHLKFYYNGGDFSEGLALAVEQKGRKFGYIDTNGLEVIKFKYPIKPDFLSIPASEFHNGLALVRKGNGHWQYIDKTGNVVLELNKKGPDYDNINSSIFSDEVAWIISYEKYTSFWQIITKTGDVLFQTLRYGKYFGAPIVKVKPFCVGYSEVIVGDADKEERICLVSKKGNICAKLDMSYNLMENKNDTSTINLVAKYLYNASNENNDYYSLSLSYNYFRKSAMLDNSYAQYVVGFMSQYGQGTEANEQEAIKWYQKSNESEAKKQLAMLEGKDVIHDPQQLFNEAFDFYYGKNGVKKDYKKAFSLFLEAAEKGDARAQNMVGCMYDDGEGTDKNKSRALYWFKKSALQGNMIAQYNLGLRYELGKDITPDATTAFSWYKNSASQGYSEALCKLGYFYQAGIGVDQNYELAKQTHLKAVELGNANSMYYLGIMYEFGKGVDKDLSQALAWYNKAVENGFTIAKSNAESLINKGVKPSVLEINSSKVDAPAASLVINTPLKEQSKQPTTIEKKNEKRIALVIGNSTYDACKRLDNLNCPMKDARDMHEKLKSLGFDMMPLITDGSEKNIRRRIYEFAHKAKEYDVALFFYSGHGIQSSPGFYKTNYLIPSDAKLEYREDIPSQCIDLNDLVLNNLSMDSTLSIVLIDACRTTLSLPSKNDLLYNSKGSENELSGLTDIKASGVCVVYAAGTGKKALEPQKENANSYFTQGLLECLDEDKDRNLLEFVYKVKNKVKKATKDKQNPAIYNETDGTFYFNPNK